MGQTLTTENEARDHILSLIRNSRDEKVFYFRGWNSFGTAPVLRSLAQVLPSIKIKNDPPELCFDRIIYIDCSAWISEREMQRKIAEELDLHKETMAIFDKHDEDDDFNGVDYGSRDLIRSVSGVIAKTLSSKDFIMIFLNGSDHEVDVSRFGISPNSLNHVVVWTFRRRLLTIHDKGAQDAIAGKLRYTHHFIKDFGSIKELNFLKFSALLREEAATIVARNTCMKDLDLATITDYCLYSLFMHYCFHGTSRGYWLSQASNCMLCDGIIKGDITKDIVNALHSEINWECDSDLLEDRIKVFMEHPESPFLMVKDETTYERRPYRWIWASITLISKVWEDIQAILETTSSFFMASESSMCQQIVPNRLFDHCNNLQVLFFSYCSFNFVSPPFHKCKTLRFLGLDHCIDNKETNNVDECMEWTFLNKLWTLDMHYTHWDEIITEEKLDLMTCLEELNIEGSYSWKHICTLQGRLCNLKRLRIIKPMQQAETSLDCNNSFLDKIKLELLDLSGNRDLKNLPTSLSKASSLQVLILDGCEGLDNVIVSNGLPSSIRSFSLDGYGPATLISTIDLPLESSRPKCAPGTIGMAVRISKISLQGCTKLANLFVRGLPNLEELDLSGTIIKVLDFQTMVIVVPRLRRLFLLGCHHLRAIRWGKYTYKRLELICLDTRAGRAPIFAQPSLAQHKKELQVHAILADARLTRSLDFLTTQDIEKVVFNIHMTSSIEDGRAIEPVMTSQQMIGPRNRHHGILSNQYSSVLSKIGDAQMLAFPEPPTHLMDRHMEFSDASLCLETELLKDNVLNGILTKLVQSLHVHDFMIGSSMPGGIWGSLKWCRIERCPHLDTIFDGTVSFYDGRLETIWVSDLLMARHICSKGYSMYSFARIQHLHLRSCPRLQFVLLVTSFAYDLKTIHIIHCGDLKHVFVKDHSEWRATHTDAQFPKLTTIHLHDLPKLQQICEVKMLAPALETIRIRGCFGLRCLPAVAVREPGQRRPTVEIEKDVWDALEWDKKVVKMVPEEDMSEEDMSVDVGHHPDLFEPPVHSRYFKKRHIRGTVLR